MKKITSNNNKFQLMKEKITSLTNSDMTKVLGGKDSLNAGKMDSNALPPKDSLLAPKALKDSVV